MTRRQPREHPVRCWCGDPTWNYSALCDRHDDTPEPEPGYVDPADLRPRISGRAPTGEYFEDDP